MPFAHGSNPASVNSRGQNWFDVTEYGAVAGSTTSNLTAAWAKIYPLLTNGSVVYFPANPLPYYWTDPLVCPYSDVTFLGDGAGASKVQAQTGHCKPFTLLAHPIKTDDGKGIDADHFVNLSTWLDSSYGPSHYGLRFRSPSTGKPVIASYPGSAMQCGPGDRWQSTQKGAFSFAFVGWNNGQPSFLADGASFGMCDVGGNPNPWYFVFIHAPVDNSTNIAGPATAYGVNTATLPATTTPGLALANRQFLILSGTGAGQIKTITAYDTSTRVCTLDSNWTTIPDSTSRYTVGSPSLEWHFKSADGLLNNTPGLYDTTYGGANRGCTWVLGKYTGLCRLWVQYDLTQSTAHNFAQCFASLSGAGSAAANFVQLADPATGAPPLPNPRFQEPSYSPFMLNSVGPQTDFSFIPGHPTVTAGAVMDWMICGLQLIKGTAGGNVWSVGAAGSTPVINPSGPCAGTVTINDSFHFGNGFNASAVFSLNFTDNATTDPYGGVLSRYFIGHAASNGGLNGVGYVLPLNPDMYGAYCHVRDLTIGVSERWHSCIDLGRAYECTFEGLETTLGWWGIANLPTAANYPHTVRNCHIDLTGDACIFGFESLWNMDNCHFGHPYGVLARGAGTDMYVYKSYTDFQTGHYGFVSHAYGYGGSLVIDGMIVDNESGAINATPDLAFLYVENPNGSGGFARVSISNIETTAIGADGFLLKLRNGGSNKQMRVEVRELQMQHACRALIAVDDATRLVGVIEHMGGELNWDVAPALESFDASGGCAIRHKLDCVTHPPLQGSWVRGAHEIAVADAAPGLWAKYLVKSAGRFGTATKPVFEGVEAAGQATTSSSSDAIFGAIAVPEDYATAAFA